MARRVIIPSSAGGSGILSPENALVSDGAFASIPAGPGASNSLILSGMIDGVLPEGEEVAGLEAVIRLGYETEAPPDGIDRSGFGMGYWAAGASIGGPMIPAPESWDGNPGTFFWSGSNNPMISVAVIHDLGVAKSVGAAKWSYSAISAGVPALHYSNDGMFWTHVSWASGGGPDAYGGSDAVRTEWVGFTPATARFWRMSYLLAQAFKIREFWLYAGPTEGGIEGEGGIGGE